MRHAAAFFAVAASLFVAVPAFADITGAAPPATQLALSTQQRKLLEQSLALQQTRVTELQAVSSNAKTQVATMQAQATANAAEATSFKSQADGFRSAADAATDSDTKKKLKGFADDCDAYAKRDNEFAAMATAAGAIFQKQADIADKAIAAHNTTISKIQTQLGK